mmetsp:Transcript_2689/g.8683  ORF Transcript_2689/g.8683 Transcript_2689/m.8683 type:complete len:415 (+) Transcript_2689:741-1985(+)
MHALHRGDLLLPHLDHLHRRRLHHPHQALPRRPRRRGRRPGGAGQPRKGLPRHAARPLHLLHRHVVPRLPQAQRDDAARPQARRQLRRHPLHPPLLGHQLRLPRRRRALPRHAGRDCAHRDAQRDRRVARLVRQPVRGRDRLRLRHARRRLHLLHRRAGAPPRRARLPRPEPDDAAHQPQGPQPEEGRRVPPRPPRVRHLRLPHLRLLRPPLHARRDRPLDVAPHVAHDARGLQERARPDGLQGDQRGRAAGDAPGHPLPPPRRARPLRGAHQDPEGGPGGRLPLHGRHGAAGRAAVRAALAVAHLGPEEVPAVRLRDPGGAQAAPPLHALPVLLPRRPLRPDQGAKPVHLGHLPILHRLPPPDPQAGAKVLPLRLEQGGPQGARQVNRVGSRPEAALARSRGPGTEALLLYAL